MMRLCALTLAVLAPAASLEMNSRLLQRAVRRHLGNAAAVAAVATAGPAAFALEFSVAPEPPPPAANSGGFGLPLPSMPSMPSMGMPSMPSLPTPSLPSMPSLPTPSMPSLPSLPSFPAAPDAPAKGGGDIVRGLDLPPLPPLFAPATPPSLPSFPVLPKEDPAPADAPGLSLPKLSAPSLPSLPGVPGLPALPALPQVEINPIANIAVERPSVPDDAAPIEYDDLVKKARLGGVTKVEFLSANGDVAVATLSDGSLRSIKVEDDKSGSYKLAAKMRDYGVPYTYSFNLGKFNEAAKRTSMRSKNQNVLDAEARQRDEDARLAALDARLAAESAPPAEAAPAAPAE